MSFKAALLSGAKGGGGSSASFRTAPDNLRSTDTYEILLGVGSGRIKLAPGGLANLFINDVPVEDQAGNASFTDLTATWFDGDPTVLNPVKLNLGASGGETAVGLTLSNPNTGAPGDWVTAAITQTGVDFVDLRFVVQELWHQTTNGIDNATANIEVELRPAGATTWTNPLTSVAAPTYDPDGYVPNIGDYRVYALKKQWDDTGTQWRATDPTNPGYLSISGKTTSTYVKELRIAVPNDGAYVGKSWEVRCRLVEKDDEVVGTDGTDETKRTIVWESISGASMAPLGGTEEWRGLSYLQLFGKATDQINGVPTVTSICDLDIYPVPPSSVWDPTSRVYTGVAWDGVTTQIAWTQCPAWQIKKLIEDDLSGISALAPGSTLNKWDALEASKWFATLVPDGNGGTEPRYSLNWFLDQGMEVGELVNYLAGAVGAFAWDEGDGNWRLKVEKPETPQMIFTKENIVGEFTYQHTDIDTRFNSITAVYRDRDNRYRESRVRVYDQADIDATGLRHTTIVLVGCDHRQEALRRTYIRLLTCLKEIRMVSFKTNRLASLLEPLSVVGIADGDLNSDTALRSTGRIVDTSTDLTRITVRDTLRLETGVAYTVNITIPNPDYNPDTAADPGSTDWRSPTTTITRNIVNTAAQRGDVRDLYLDAAVPSNLPEYAVVALEATGLPALPKQYRIVGIQPDDDGEFSSVSAVEIYTSKWDESDAITEAAIDSQSTVKSIDPPTIPTGGMFRLDTYSSGTANRRVLVTSWVRPAGAFVDGYRVSYRYNGGPWFTVAQNTQDTFYELPDPAPGTYEFQIIANDRRGVWSTPLDDSITLADGVILPPVGFLTNESHTVAAANDGTGFDLTNAGGIFELFSPAGQIANADITFSVVSATGASATINSSGVYAITGLTADTATVTFRAAWNAYPEPVDKVYTISKSKGGSNAELLFLTSSSQTFKYAADGTPDAGQSSTFTAVRQNTTATLTWQILNMSGALMASGTAAALAADGIGTSSAVDNITIDQTQFNTIITAAAGAWGGAAGDGTGIIVLVTLTDGALTLTDKISVVKVSDGAQGTSGPSGLNSAQVLIYQRAATTPAVPSVTTTYTFSTAHLSGLNNGWSQSIPASTGDPLWVTAATALGSGTTDDITSAEWAGPVIMAQDGSGGAGSNGLNNATVYLFRRAASTPSVPSSTTTYTFASGVLDNINNLWTQAVPANDGNPLWVTTATALGTGSTDTISPSEWAAASIMAQDGAPAKAVKLSADRLTVTCDQPVGGDGHYPLNPASQNITLTANPQNVSAPVWSLSDDIGTADATLQAAYLTGTGNTRTLAAVGISDSGRKWIKVTVTADGISDSVTITRSLNGLAGTGAGGSVAYDFSKNGTVGGTASFPVAVTSGLVYFKGFIETLNDALASSGSLDLCDASGTEVFHIADVSAGAAEDITVNYDVNYNTGLAGGVWEQWSLLLRYTKGGSGGGSASTSGVMHQ